jgi:hypothetical protein
MMITDVIFKSEELLIEISQMKARGLIFVDLLANDQRFYRKLLLNDLLRINYS